MGTLGSEYDICRYFDPLGNCTHKSLFTNLLKPLKRVYFKEPSYTPQQEVSAALSGKARQTIILNKKTGARDVKTQTHLNNNLICSHANSGQSFCSRRASGQRLTGSSCFRCIPPSLRQPKCQTSSYLQSWAPCLCRYSRCASSET